MRILILGASYGSLLSTKLLMAGHDTTLVCKDDEAELVNSEGTVVRLKLRDEDEHRSIESKVLPGKVDAVTPDKADPKDYDMVALAMQEPQYSAEPVKKLLARAAAAESPCLSIMNMPPLPYLMRIEALKGQDLTACFADASVWDRFDPDRVTLCSPDPQAFRPPEEKLNLLHVGLPTNFKAADFVHDDDRKKLAQLSADIDAVRLDGKEVPVKLRVHESIFVPMAKWSMLLTGNYRCILPDAVQPIKDAVHGDLEASKAMYAWVDELVESLGASSGDHVPFEKYANAANGLLKPSSAARAIDAGMPRIERVDRLVQTIGAIKGVKNETVDRIVEIVDARLKANAG